MNLSPLWEEAFSRRGIEARHWSAIGKPDASDREILSWAAAHGFVVFTHDLDFGSILAASGVNGPSVIQLREQDISPDHSAPVNVELLERFADQLARGALVSLDTFTRRVRLLPLKR